jgi:capsular exopolysaccharide synthesis family protein
MTLPIEATRVMPLETAMTGGDSGNVHLGQIISALWRRRSVFLSVAFLIIVLGFVILKLLTPLYDSTVVLVLSARQDGVVDMQQAYMNTPPSDPVVRAEVDALKSRTLIDRIIDRAGLMADPEFNQYARAFHPNPVVCFPARLFPGFLKVKLGCRKPDASALSPEQVKYNVASQVLRAFTVTPDPKTYSVKLDVASVDAQKAGRLANLWAAEYMQRQVDEKVTEAERAMSSLNPRLEKLSKDVARADSAVEDYKQSNHILSLPGAQGDNNTLALQEVQSLSLELANARTARAKLEAAQQEVRKIQRNPAQALSAPAVAAAPLVESVREQEGTAAAQLASLQGTYGERHPLVVSARSQLEELRQRLDQEVQRAIQQLDVQVRQSQVNEQQLQARISQLSSARNGENKNLPQLRQLDSAQAAAKTVYDAFMQGAYRAAAQNGVPTARGRIVQSADTADWPTFPNIPISMAVISIAALLIAAGVVYALEATDHSFHSAGEVEDIARLTVLGMTLAAPSRSIFAVRKKTGPLSRLMITEPSSALSESLRLTRAAIASSRPDRLTKVVMITSSVPGEGKTTFALMLGRQSAATGKRTIVVEAEMRRPKFGRDLQPLPAKGLSDYLEARASLEEVVGVDEDSGLHFIAAGSSSHNCGELLGSSRMAVLLDHLGARYDLVVIDTPPAAIVADALQLSGMVDAAILLVKWASTPRHLVLDGMKKLQAAKAPLVGAVMTQVDARKYKLYGQGPLAYDYARSYYTRA